jgi:hypothetical protein
MIVDKEKTHGRLTENSQKTQGRLKEDSRKTQGRLKEDSQKTHKMMRQARMSPDPMRNAALDSIVSLTAGKASLPKENVSR